MPQRSHLVESLPRNVSVLVWVAELPGNSHARYLLLCPVQTELAQEVQVRVLTAFPTEKVQLGQTMAEEEAREITEASIQKPDKNRKSSSSNRTGDKVPA